ncbi:MULTISPECIES: type IV pilus modification PilV family protein [unclassified Moraxella]|uniref:type IV pilus modification PilV family protein n=1 Tax=unclassified Moraxella TaxID=2685852 RepID=UPI002B40ADC5|nr:MULTISPECIES: prepilin-type N-terminal cleavage/methylation domain-containing protein [unclassified Moraxella]
MKVMRFWQNQQGFSLIEMLVALLLVSVAFLGFLMVQVKANGASKDAKMRTTAVSLMTAHAEVLRNASDADKQIHAELFGRLNRSNGTSIQMMNDYRIAINAIFVSCQQSGCNSTEFIKYRTLWTARLAAKEGVRLNAISQNGTYQLIAAWGDTPATQGKNGCVLPDGKINRDAHCMTMTY